MESAGKEEKDIAIAKGNIDRDGIPKITVSNVDILKIRIYDNKRQFSFRFT